MFDPEISFTIKLIHPDCKLVDHKAKTNSVILLGLM